MILSSIQELAIYTCFLIKKALCQMMLVKRNLRIIWTEQKEEKTLSVLFIWLKMFCHDES